jgi:hypothetical protein
MAYKIARLRATNDPKHVGDGYPFGLVSNQRDNKFLFTRAEMEELRDDIDAMLAPPPPRYVTVKIIGQDEREWHYEDTSGTLVKDDLVRVNWGGATKVGIVRGTDRTPPSWLGKPGGGIKPVLARFTAEEL